MKADRIFTIKQRGSHAAPDITKVLFGVNMGNHAALNTIVVMTLLSGVSTLVQPIRAERCQTSPENGQSCKELCSLGPHVQNMVRRVNTCLDRRTWAVTGNNPIILVPQIDNDTKDVKKTFTWRQLELMPPESGSSKTAYRIRCIPQCSASDKSHTVKNMKQIRLKHGNKISSQRQSAAKEKDSSIEDHKIEARNKASAGAKEHDELGNENPPQKTEKKDEEKEERTRDDSKTDVKSEAKNICIPAVDILLYNPQCANNSSKKPETADYKKSENDGVVKCERLVEAVCPGMNILHCLACLQSERGHGNIEELNNPKYSEESMRITIEGRSDRKSPLTKQQLDQLSRINFPNAIQALKQSEKPVVVQVEDKSLNKISRYIILGDMGDMMVGISLNEQESETKNATTSKPKTATAPPAITTSVTTPAITIITRPPLVQKQDRFPCRQSFMPCSKALIERPPFMYLEPPFPQHLPDWCPNCFEPLYSVPCEPLVGDFHCHGIPNISEHLPCGTELATTKTPTSGQYHQTATGTLKNADLFEMNHGSAERSLIYNGCCCGNNYQHDTGSWITEDVLSEAEDCEDHQDHGDFEKAETSSIGPLRQYPPSWNARSAYRTTTNAPGSYGNRYKESSNVGHNDVKEVQNEPRHGNGNSYQQFPCHYRMTQQEIQGQRVVNQPMHDCSTQQHPGRPQSARQSEYTTNYYGPTDPMYNHHPPQYSRCNGGTKGEYTTKPPHKSDSRSGSVHPAQIEHQTFKNRPATSYHPTHQYMSHPTNYYDHPMNKGQLRCIGSPSTPVKVPQYRQGHPTWGKPTTPNNNVNRATIPLHFYHDNCCGSHHRTVCPRMMGGYSDRMCNPLPQTQAQNGYILPPINVC